MGLRTIFRKIRRRISTQTLDRRPGDTGFEATGRFWKEGRATLYLDDRADNKLHASWNLWTRFCGLDLSVSSDGGVTLHASFPPAALWLSAEFRFFWKWTHENDWKSIGFTIHDGAIWVNLWADASCHSFEKTKGFWHPHKRRLCWQPLDTFFGQKNHSERVLEETPVVIPMVEGLYKGKAIRRVEQWRRPRWPWWPSAVQVVRVQVKMQDPVPFPGKGENSWDCGEDALYGMTSNADTVPKAIAAVVESVLTSRRRHGGPNWRPAEKEA